MKTRVLLLVTGIFCTITTNLLAQGTAFTYQGWLNEGASPANGIYDLRFTICPAATVKSGRLSPIPPSVSGGVALAAIQGSNQKLEEQLKIKDLEITTLKRELAEIKRSLTQLAAKGN